MLVRRAAAVALGVALATVAVLTGCGSATAGHPHAAARAMTDDDRLFVRLVRATAGASVAGFGDGQLVRAAEGVCQALRTAPGGPAMARADPPAPTGLPGASPTALAAVTGWGSWTYCPELVLPH